MGEGIMLMCVRRDRPPGKNPDGRGGDHLQFELKIE